MRLQRIIIDPFLFKSNQEHSARSRYRPEKEYSTQTRCDCTKRRYFLEKKEVIFVDDSARLREDLCFFGVCCGSGLINRGAGGGKGLNYVLSKKVGKLAEGTLREMRGRRRHLYYAAL